MKDSAKPTGSNLPSELRWRIAIPLLRHGGVPGPEPQAVAAGTAPAAAGNGRGMAGMLPGVTPITFGHALHAPSAARS